VLPWDLEDEGLETSLARMAGEIGVDGLSVIASYSGIRQYRSRSVYERRLVEHDAATHFQPDPKRYVNTRVRPAAASWMKSRNPLERIARAAEKAHLKLRVQAAACRDTGLTSKYPMASCVNVFGDPVNTWLCRRTRTCASMSPLSQKT